MTATPLTWLALGDSYTIGEGVADAARWPLQVAAALRAEGIAMTGPDIIATTGWTTDELDAGIDAAAPQGPYDLVSLLIGVNDQYRGRPLADYLPAFEGLLQRAIGFAGGKHGRVLVLSIPDWGVTPFARAQGRDAARIAAELDAYNGAAAEACTHAGVAFVDITPISRAHCALLADDGLHPSADMYARWAEAALPTARMLLADAH